LKSNLKSITFFPKCFFTLFLLSQKNKIVPPPAAPHNFAAIAPFLNALSINFSILLFVTSL
jgi:hypothetical protein